MKEENSEDVLDLKLNSKSLCPKRACIFIFVSNIRLSNITDKTLFSFILGVLLFFPQLL